MIARAQLRALGFTDRAIRHRLAKGRLHRVWPDVYAVGRPDLEQQGIWMAAVLTCGPGAALSHESAAALYGIRPGPNGPIHVSLPSPRDRRRAGIRVHRRRELRVAGHRGIPVTPPADTILDIAAGLTEQALERLIDEADRLDLVHPAGLRAAAEGAAGAGASSVRSLLDRRTFVPTDSELERRFLRIARNAGFPEPETQVRVNGHRVDFYFRERGVVVETDGGRYHRTPSQQRRDRIRDHAHAVAGMAAVRFTHGQVAHEPDYVAGILRRL